MSASSSADGRLAHLNLIEGDSVEVLDTLPENSIHAIVCDPPYAISFQDEEWDQFRRKRNEDDAARDDFGGRLSSTAPASGAEGDNKEFQLWCQLWGEQALTPLKPGGHIIAFGGNRTHHRLMVGLEDAGYEVRDTITWHYGEGMPKGASLSTWLDGVDAEQWGDWRGTLKPATEFAVLARAPLDESSATQNQVEHGVGNLNIEHCRITTSDTHPNQDRDGEATKDDRYTDDGSTDFAAQPGPRGGDENGRYPPNVALDPVMADLMDLLSGDLESGELDLSKHVDRNNQEKYGTFSGGDERTGTYGGDSGGASRFFYCSKASKSERTHDNTVENDHPTVKPLDLMEWLIKLVTAEGQTVLDPFAGSGTTLLAADNVNRYGVGIEENPTYIEIANQRITHMNGNQETEEHS